MNEGGIRRMSKPPRKTERTPTPDEWAKAEQRAKPRRHVCGYCGQPGHRNSIQNPCPEYLKRFR